MIPEKKERNKRIVELKKSGKSYNDIAKYFNLTQQRVQAICKKYMPVDKRLLTTKEERV